METLMVLIFMILAVSLSVLEKSMKSRQSETSGKRNAQYSSASRPAGSPLGKSGARPAAASAGKKVSTAGTKSSTTQAVREKARVNATTTIVDRAKANTAKLAEDETLRQIEEAHGHSETHVKAPVEHSRNCQTLDKDANAVENAESILGTTEDLIVKGYSGSLHFERDFLAEGMDMLAAISVSDTAVHEK